MALMKSLQEKLPEPGYIYSQMIEKSLEPALSEAAKLIEQALEEYEPLDYENEKTREKLAQALEKLAEKDWQEQEMSVPALVIEIYDIALLSALEMSRGEWDQAEKLSEKTLDLARKLIEIEEGLKAFNELDDLLQTEDISKLLSLSAQKNWDLSALSRQSLLSLSLLASLQYFRGCLAQQQLKLKEALDYFNASIQTYEKALKLISLLSLSKLLDKRDEVELETGLIHALQRVHKRLADLAGAEVLFPLADQHYLKIIELGEMYPQRTFQFEMLAERPAYFRLFDAHARREADEKSLEDYQIAQDSFSTLKWQALLSLDFPDLEEIAELFNFHYARIEAWLEETGREAIRNPREDVTPVLTLLENLMDLKPLFLDSELFYQIEQENGPEQRKEELKDLYQMQLARFQKGLRDIREGKEPPFFEYHYDFWLTPRERDLYNQYDNYFDRALEYEFSEDLHNKDDRALRAYYTSLLYLSALINQCSNPMSQEEFEVKLYELYEKLGQYYLDHNDPRQAARFLEKAYFYEKDLCLEEFDYEPKDKAELCFSLALVMEDLEQKEKAKKYRLECITQQLSQIEVEMDYMAPADTREAILKLPSVNQLQEYLDIFFGEAPLEEEDEFFEDLLAQEDHPQGRKYLIELLFYPEQFKGWDE